MPHVSDVRSTSHDRHDPMLVAALAADDLAGTDRDQAIALTRSCAECATLHDDLGALARATAAAPPPVSTRPRDFRLTPADAARLRPSGWRRLVAAASSSRVIFSRPLGAGLATLGLVGLLVGNVPLSVGFGSAASAPVTVSGAGAPAAPAASMARAESAGDAAASGSSGEGLVAAPVPVASSATAAGAGPASAAASGAPSRAGGNFGSAGGSGLPDQIQPVPIAVTPDKNLASEQTAGDRSALTGTVAGEPFRPLNLLFAFALVVGIGLLLASRFRGRRPA
jgi:hypothetical protein